MQIIDNINITVKENLQSCMHQGSKLSVAAACFSIYAYQELKKQLDGICSPLTGVTSNSWDTPAGHRIYDACRGSSVSWVCRGSGASIVSSTSC